MVDQQVSRVSRDECPSVMDDGAYAAYAMERCRADYEGQMQRLMRYLSEASQGGELPSALRALDEFLCVKLSHGGANALRAELFSCFDMTTVRNKEVRDALTVRSLGASLAAAEGMQRRMLLDFEELKGESVSVPRKGKKRKGRETFAEVIAGEMVDDLIALHRERLWQATAFFDLGEPDAALTCLNDHACFLDCAVLPHASLLSEIACNEAWLALPDAARLLRGALWEGGLAGR